MRSYKRKRARFIHSLLPPFFHEPWKLPLEWGRLGGDASPLCRIVVSGIVFLLFDGSGVVGRESGSRGGSSSIVVAGMIVVSIGCSDVGLASGFELLESLLEERGGVFGGAPTLHAGGDIGPEAGGEGVFDFLLSQEEVLMLLSCWLADLRFGTNR